MISNKEFHKQAKKLIPKIKKYRYIGYAEYENYGRGWVGYDHCILAKVSLNDAQIKNIATDAADKYDFNVEKAIKNADIDPIYEHIYLAFALDNQGLLIDSKKELTWNCYGINLFQTYEEAKEKFLKDLGSALSPKMALISSILNKKWLRLRDWQL